MRASALRPAIWRAGFAAQASNRSQSLAGTVTIRRSSISVSAASSALRRTKSLTLVRACEDAASKSVRSWSLNRTLSTDDDMMAFPVSLSVACMTLAYSDLNVNLRNRCPRYQERLLRFRRLRRATGIKTLFRIGCCTLLPLPLKRPHSTIVDTTLPQSGRLVKAPALLLMHLKYRIGLLDSKRGLKLMLVVSTISRLDQS